jgi:hypothetical protein
MCVDTVDTLFGDKALARQTTNVGGVFAGAHNEMKIIPLQPASRQTLVLMRRILLLCIVYSPVYRRPAFD